MTIAVIGAGIVGVSTALWLQRAGEDVLLIDRDGPAAGTSFGNAGVIASGAVIPVTVPGLIRSAPKMLIDPDMPLFLRWRYLPKLLPFLWRYLRHANAGSMREISENLHLLLHDAADQHAALARGTAAAEFLDIGDYLHGYESRAAFDADAKYWARRAELGVPFERLEGEAIAGYDPALGGRFEVIVRGPGQGAIRDPGAYVTALFDAFLAAGGRFQLAEMRDVHVEKGRVHGIDTTTGTIEADRFVLTVGAWSGPIAKKLGVRVPLESERGYHVEFHDPSIQFKSPVMVSAGQFVATSMRGRLRCAGIVEFGGLEAGPSEAPFDLLERTVQRVFPDLEYSHTTRWMGHRPATSDSLPVIGQSPRANNFWLGYGHQHIGLTAGPKTGRWLAQMMTDKPPNQSLAAFDPARRG